MIRFLCIPVFFIATTLHADLIITVNDANISPGGTATVDMQISSTGSDDLGFFGFEFLIVTAGATQLEFVDPQSDSQLTDPAYVFAGDSSNQVLAFPVGSVSTTIVPNDTFIGGDFTDSFGNIAVSSPKLLARLELSSATFLAPGIGDTFTITLDAASLNTFFETALGDPIALDVGASRLVSTVAVVPEPSYFPIFCLLSTGFLGFKRYRFLFAQ